MPYLDSIHVSNRMLEKRRGASTQFAAFILTLTVVLLLWRHSGCPGPPTFYVERPGYLLVLAGNATTLPPPYALRTLPFDDRDRLVDLPRFRFLHNSPTCNGTNYLVIVLVHSDPRNFDKRNAIRDTWGTRLKVIFLLGATLNLELQADLDKEIEIYHDIVQGDFLDAYRNMTYKNVMGLKWMAYHCQSARYLLKTDDDVFVNPTALLHYLRNSLSPHGARRLILCSVFNYGIARRSYRSKWRVSYAEYSGQFYPPYCQGWAVIYSPDVVFQLYKEAQAASYFWIDDVFVTGLMAARANIGRSTLGDLILSEKRVKDLQKKEPFGDFFIFGPPNLSVSDIYALWEIVRNWGDHIPS